MAATKRASEPLSSVTRENPFVSRFVDFFTTHYLKQLEELSGQYPDKRSLEVDFAELDAFDTGFADELLSNPDALIEASELALQEMSARLSVSEETPFSPHVRFFNLPEQAEVFLREVGSDQLLTFISVEGIIKQITETLPRLQVGAWKCTRCDAIERLPQASQVIQQPGTCKSCKNTGFGLVEEESQFSDYQKLQIQEPLEKLRGNDQPTSLDVYLSDDQVNRVAPGDHISVCGILRLYPPTKRKVVFGRYLDAVHVTQTQQEFEEVEVSAEEEKQIRKLAKDKDIYETLIKSVAPTIYGHEVVKEAIVLQLFGGVKKTLPDRQTIRGNVHVLLVGDPGTGKSQLLMATNNISPKGVYVAGKTTSGVGLSAAAVKDEFGEGGWTLKAGALVLASGGTVMADELDKMDPDDRVALHEAMEQGTISVAKAGIVTRFKTDTSILAAANPKYSRFDPMELFIKQVDLPATLISRFDLFFMIRDVMDRTKDSDIAYHILNTHKKGSMLSQSLRSGKSLTKREKEQTERGITPAVELDLLKKYISFARQNVFPCLSKKAMQSLHDFYVGLREQGKQQETYSATHRQLEGLVRLSEASARVRLSDVVELEDAQRAIRLVEHCLQNMLTDPQTGKVDIDIVATGQTQSQVEGLKGILKIVRARTEETGEAVEINYVFEQAKELNMSEERVRELLSMLERKGDIYRPRHDKVKPTEHPRG